MDVPSAHEHQDLRLLESIYDAFEDPGTVQSARATLRPQFEDEDTLDHWLREQKQTGTMDDGNRLASIWVLTPAGQERVRQAKQRRGDLGARHGVLRDRLIAWASNNMIQIDRADRMIGGFYVDPLGWFEGQPFEESDVNEVSGWLEQKGLLKRMTVGGGVVARIGITHAGRDCAIEHAGSVSSWLASERQGAGGVTINALAVAIGEGATANATQIDGEAVSMLARALREALPQLDLGAGGEGAVEDLESDDDNRRKRGLRWLGTLATDTGSGALGNVLGTVAMMLLGGG